MSFFQLSDGAQLDNTGEFELAGNIAVIPDNTQVKAFIDEAKWDEYEGDRYVNIRWNIVDQEYNGRKIYQKVRVCDTDSKKRDKAIRMLAAIDTNCGGNLMRLGVEPDDMQLSINLTNKPMLILLKVWEIKNDVTGVVEKDGNWVCAVAPANKPQAQQAQAAQQQSQPNVDDIGF